MYKVSTLVLLVFAPTGAPQETPDTTFFLQASPGEGLPAVTLNDVKKFGSAINRFFITRPPKNLKYGTKEYNEEQERIKIFNEKLRKGTEDGMERDSCCCVKRSVKLYGKIIASQEEQDLSATQYCKTLHDYMPFTAHYNRILNKETFWETPTVQLVWQAKTLVQKLQLATSPTKEQPEKDDVVAECCWAPYITGLCTLQSINPLPMGNVHREATKLPGKCKDRTNAVTVGYIDKTFAARKIDIGLKLQAARLVRQALLRRAIAGGLLKADAMGFTGDSGSIVGESGTIVDLGYINPADSGEALWDVTGYFADRLNQFRNAFGIKSPTDLLSNYGDGSYDYTRDVHGNVEPGAKESITSAPKWQDSLQAAVQKGLQREASLSFQEGIGPERKIQGLEESTDLADFRRRRIARMRERLPEPHEEWLAGEELKKKTTAVLQGKENAGRKWIQLCTDAKDADDKMEIPFQSREEEFAAYIKAATRNTQMIKELEKESETLKPTILDTLKQLLKRK